MKEQLKQQFKQHSEQRLAFYKKLQLEAQARGGENRWTKIVENEEKILASINCFNTK